MTSDSLLGGAGLTILITICCYLAVMLVIGAVAGRFSGQSLANYFLAGRQMKDWVVALSAVASGRSAWLVLGASGMAFKMGLGAVWALPGYIFAELLMFWLLGVRLRRFTGRTGDITIPDYLESRFQDRSHLLRIVAVVLFFLFVAPYMAAQFSGGGKMFSAALGFEPVWGVVITALIVLVYTVLGGFLGVSLTDVLQALLMFVALLVLPALVVSELGGVGQVLAQLGGIDAALADPFSIPLLIGGGSVLGLLAIGLGSPGNPHILVRYMSVDDPNRLRRAALLGTVWNVLMGWGAIWIGLAGRVIFVSADALPGSDTEQIFPLLAQEYFAPVLVGLMISAVLAAIMSTSDSQALIVASGVVQDVIHRITRWGQGLSQATLVALSRLVVLVLVGAALAWSLLSELEVVKSETVFWLVLLAWSGLGSSFGPVMILSLYWRRMTKWGAFAGMLTGAVVTAVWGMTPALDSKLYELIPAFILAWIAIVVVSWLTPGREEGRGKSNSR